VCFITLLCFLTHAPPCIHNRHNRHNRRPRQEEAIRELQAALEAKDDELQAARREAAAEADAAVVARMQVRVWL
jgi:hypothetical protein